MARMADETQLPARGLHRPGDDEVGPTIFETGDAPPVAPPAVRPPAQQLAEAPTDAVDVVAAADAAPTDGVEPDPGIEKSIAAAERDAAKQRAEAERETAKAQKQS